MPETLGNGTEIMTRFTENEKVALAGAMQAGTARGSVAARVARLARMTRESVRRSRQRAAVVRELSDLSDRVLADIGIGRWDIDEIAEQAAGPSAPNGKALIVELGSILSDVLVAPVAAWLRRGHTYRDLMALDDHSLSDIGITRGQIPAIVAGMRSRDAGGEPLGSADIVRPIRVWNRSRIAAKELSAFDDRTLQDIGMVRGDIDDVAAELAERSMLPANAQRAPHAA